MGRVPFRQPGRLCITAIQVRVERNIFFDTYAPMRTTIDVDDALLRAVKARAARERRTLKETFELALRAYLAGPAGAPADPPPIPVFRGEGVQPGVELTDNAALLAIMEASP